MPDKNDAYTESQIILNTEDWMIVEPMTGLAFEYFAPEKIKSEWSSKFRNGDVYFVIDKGKEPIQIYTIFKNDTDHKVEYIGSEVHRHRVMTRNALFHELPDEVKSELEPVIGYSLVYELLVKISNGEQISSSELERADEIIYDLKYAPKAPFKSKITLKFDDDSDYIKLFDPTDDDLWYFERIFSNYDSYEWEDSYQTTEDFRDGYLFYSFNDENRQKLKEILSIVLPESASLEDDEQKSNAGEKLYEMFEREIDNIVSDYSTIMNECKTQSFKDEMKSNLCDVFQNYGIFKKYCFHEYFTSVGMLLSLYDSMGDKTLNISELLFKIGSDMNLVGWGEYIYETQCDDFDDEEFNRYSSGYLDDIMGKLEDNSLYEDIYEYSELYKRLGTKFKVNNRYETKSGREFFYRGINPENNRIVVQVFKKDNGGMEDRSYTEEEFNNFLVSPELFEGFIRIN
jgi:hypothetical protein